MKTVIKRICSLILASLMLVSLAACGGRSDLSKKNPVTISEDGIATWPAVDGAVSYRYSICDSSYVSLTESIVTTETSVALPEGKCIHVQAMFADGSDGQWIISDYFGDPSPWPEDQSEIESVYPDHVSIGDHPSGDSITDDSSMNDDGIEIVMGENRWVSWETVDGAVEYNCKFADYFGGIVSEHNTADHSIRLPLDNSMHLTALNAEGIPIGYGYYESDGGTIDPEHMFNSLDYPYSVLIDDVFQWNLIENIDISSVQTNEDGGISFTAAAPGGGEMRFVADPGVTVSEGGMSFAPGSRIYALDSIGRICAYKPYIADPGSDVNFVYFSGGYTFDGSLSVESVDDLFVGAGRENCTADCMSEAYAYSPVMELQPNMVIFGADHINNVDDFVLSELTVYYDEKTYATPVDQMYLYFEFYGTYLVGDLYDPSRERYDSANKIFDFYLLVVPELQDELMPITADFLIDPADYVSRAVSDIAFERYEIGDLKDANGNVLDKATDPLTIGCTIEITLAGMTYDLPLPILEEAADVQTLKELIPYGNVQPVGEITTLVVPIQWSDKPEYATQELYDFIFPKVGRVVDLDGNVTDYSAENAEEFSLSAYYDLASFGQHHIESFVTDWVTAPATFEEIRYASTLEGDLPERIMELVREMYPDMDWSKFDCDDDGIMDSVIFVTACGDEPMEIMSFGGGVHNLRGYDASRAGTVEKPNIKDFICIGSGYIGMPNIIIHEYGHGLGLIDYYDVTYSGIDAVGSYDMQSSSVGDWNPYSKYAVGWIDPYIVTDLQPGESVDITIGTQSETGDAIVIPAAGKEINSPFAEYIMVDLFAATGLNEYDADSYGIGDDPGVRIYHVNARMQRRVLEDVYGDAAPIGTVHYANAENDAQKYHIELLQKGGNNTFTDLKGGLRAVVQRQDFFYAGDRFDATQFTENLDDGRMDDGSEFGYIIEVLSIEGTQATIRITRS